MENTTTETENTSTENTGDTSTETEGTEKVFTQTQVDKLIAKRLKKFEGLQATVEQLQNELVATREQAKTLESKFKETAYTSSLDSVSRELNLDPEIAAKFVDKEAVIFKDDKPTNLKDLLMVVIEKHPQLVKKQVVTPDPVPDTKQTKTYSIHKSSNNNFFNGGGLRLHNVKE